MTRALAVTVPALTRRSVLVVVVVAILAVPNAMLLGETFGFIASRHYVLDWWLFSEAVERIGSGRMYDWGAPGQFGDVYDYRYSPLFAYVMVPFTWLGLTIWRVLHLAALLLLPRKLAFVALLAWPFWHDLAHANVMIFAAVTGFLALRGSRWATAAYLVIALLVPRPLYVPLLVWIAWKRPEWRLPMLAMGTVYGALTLATGEAFAFLASLTRGTELMALQYNWGPTAWVGPVWLLAGIPIGAFLTWKGRIGWAALAGSPHILPYYLMVLLWEVGPATGTGSDAPAKTQAGRLP